MTMADQLRIYAIFPLQATHLTLLEILLLALLPVREAGTYQSLTWTWLPMQ